MLGTGTTESRLGLVVMLQPAAIDWTDHKVLPGHGLIVAGLALGTDGGTPAKIPRA